MDILVSILLGVVQGATEFLPISSSGHLILARLYLDLEAINTLGFDAVLQLATALAVLIYFWRDFWDLLKGALAFVFRKHIEDSVKVTLLALILGTIPAAVSGLLLQDYMETTFRTAEFVVVTLLAGSLLFYIAEKVATQDKTLTVKRGVGVGLFQALSLFPGMSRSGSTIAGGLILGMNREQAARFSFLLAFPIIAGSALVKMLGLAGSPPVFDLALLTGALSAFVVGIAAIHCLLKFLRNHTLAVFIWYRVILAGIVLVTLV